METLDCVNLRDLMLNDDDDIQVAYCKLYNFCMKTFKCATKLKANFKKVKLERDELIAKLDEANNLNEKFKNQISSQEDKIKSLEKQLVESKTEVEKLISAKLLVEPNSKEKCVYIPAFKRNNEDAIQKVFVAEKWVKDARNVARVQAENLTEIELTTQKQLVSDLKADLEKAKAIARTAEEAAEASRQTSYNLEVEEIEIQSAEELAEAFLSPFEASKGSSQAGDQGQGAEVAEDKGKGKEVKPSLEAKDTAKAKEVDPKAKDAFASQSSKKEDPSSSAKA
ncbi:uncharacterized protein LOC136062252 [Quercus suber]|uniref:uncharacterized protein LOC136062252 n=1 Tax=Quercus suber TaxID=58331 RepID=UPI0032E02745